MKPFNNLEYKTLTEELWKNVQAQSSFEPLLEYSQDQMPLIN